MATPRDEPYVWVTWITRLIAGEAHCRWAAWFKAHHTYAKVPSDFDAAAWTARHNEMLHKVKDDLKKEAYEVYIEAQNAFRMRGSTGVVLSGKPDLVAIKDDRALVIDCKTGNPKAADQFQVLVYMLVLPHTHTACRSRRIDGEVRYEDHTVTVPAARVTPELRGIFRETMNRTGGETPPDRVPSQDECRWCDITAADCPQRMEWTGGVAETDGAEVF